MFKSPNGYCTEVDKYSLSCGEATLSKAKIFEIKCIKSCNQGASTSGAPKLSPPGATPEQALPFGASPEEAKKFVPILELGQDTIAEFVASLEKMEERPLDWTSTDLQKYFFRRKSA